MIDEPQRAEVREVLPIESASSFSVLSILKNISSSLASLLGAMVLNFVVSWLLARELGDVIYGEYIFMLGIGGILTALADMGLSQVTIREIARDRLHAGRYLLTAVLLRLAANTAVLVIAFLLIPHVEQVQTQRTLVFVVIITLIVALLSDLLRSLFTGFEKLELDLITRVGERAITLAIIAVLTVDGITLDAAIWGILAGAVLGFVITLSATLRLTPLNTLKLDTQAGYVLFTAGLPMGLSNLIVSFYARYDVLMLGVLRTTSEVAWFSIAYSLILILASLSFAASTALFPVLSRLAHNNSAEQFRLFREALRYAMVIALGIAGAVFIAAEPAIVLLYGAQYAPAAEALRILAGALVFMFPSHLMLNLLLSLNKQNWTLSANVLSGILLLVIDPLLIVWLGVHGAALTNIVVEGTIFCVYLYLIRLKIDTVNIGAFARPLGAALVSVSVYTIVGIPEVLRAGLALGVYGFMLIILKAIDPIEVVRLGNALVQHRLNAKL